MAGNPSAAAKRRWLHDVLGVPIAKADGSGDDNDDENGDPNASAPSRTGPTAGPPGDPGAKSGLPAPMLPDCVPQLDKVAGPREHVLCKTHGHVLDVASKTIIADTVAEYDAAHPVPRPMESDCKVEQGKLPNAPDNIVMCATHGHVLDTAKKQIIANSGIVYLRAHPEHAGRPKPKSAPAQESAPTQPNDDSSRKKEPPHESDWTVAVKTKFAQWDVVVDKWNALKEISIGALIHGHTLTCNVFWRGTDKSAFSLPSTAHAVITVRDNAAQKDIAVRTGPAQPVTAPTYDFGGSVDLPKTAIAIAYPTIMVECSVIVEGVGADTLTENGFLHPHDPNTPQ